MAGIKGDVVISVNIGKEDDVTAKFPHRKGAEKEKANLEKVFVEHFKFEYLNRDVLNGDLSRKQWDHALDEVNIDPNTRTNCDGKCLLCLIDEKADPKSKYFVFALTSHGYTSDGEMNIRLPGDYSVLALKDIIVGLKSSKKLEEKIVIIAVDSCRSPGDGANTEDSGIAVVCPIDTSAKAGSASNIKDENTAKTGDQTGVPMTNVQILPAEDNIKCNQINLLLDLPQNYLVINGTTANRPSYRDTIKGSWFEDALAEVVDTYVKNKKTKSKEVNFLQLLTDTNRNVAEREVRSANVPSTTADDSAGKDLAKATATMRVSECLETPPITDDEPHIEAGVKGAERLCTSPETAVTVSTNVVAEQGATPGSKCCIQIVHRLTEPVTFML